MQNNPIFTDDDVDNLVDNVHKSHRFTLPIVDKSVDMWTAWRVMTRFDRQNGLHMWISRWTMWISVRIPVK